MFVICYWLSPPCYCSGQDPEAASEGNHAAAEEEGGSTAMDQSQDPTEQVPDTSIYGSQTMAPNGTVWCNTHNNPRMKEHVEHNIYI
jgi:hypothetical protein